VLKWEKIVRAFTIILVDNIYDTLAGKLPPELSSFLYSRRSGSLAKFCGFINNHLTRQPWIEMRALKDKFPESDKNASTNKFKQQQPSVRTGRVNVVEEVKDESGQSQSNQEILQNAEKVKGKPNVINTIFQSYPSSCSPNPSCIAKERI